MTRSQSQWCVVTEYMYYIVNKLGETLPFDKGLELGSSLLRYGVPQTLDALFTPLNRLITSLLVSDTLGIIP